MPEPSLPARPQILVNTLRRVCAMNRKARRLLSLHADLLRLRVGRLQRFAAPLALERRLVAAPVGKTTVLFPDQPADRHTPSLRMEPVPLNGTADIRQLFRDPKEVCPDASLLRQLFSLAPTEAKVAEALHMRHSSRELTQAMDVQVNTVQAHVQLVSPILRNAAMCMSPATEGARRRSPCSSNTRTHRPAQA